ncbi:hypothetical protein HYQ44_016170 [Verticillium longisporum]|nr:hypothetical protein HYQ44_016170 [Verticillium longisporum]
MPHLRTPPPGPGLLHGTFLPGRPVRAFRSRSTLKSVARSAHPQSGQSGRAIVEGDHLCRCVAPPSSHRAASKERHRHLSACKIIMCFFTRCRGTT